MRGVSKQEVEHRVQRRLEKWERRYRREIQASDISGDAVLAERDAAEIRLRQEVLSNLIPVRAEVEVVAARVTLVRPPQKK